MSSLYQQLVDPQLVASFQRACGVRIEDETDYQLPEASLTPNKMLSEKNDSEKSSCHARLSPPILPDRIKNSFPSNKKVSYNPFFHRLFQLGSELGNELFFFIFFPVMIWHVDTYIARRLVLLWALGMYVGQALKDIFRQPRPPYPPVVRLELTYESEYGMPSTHVVNGLLAPFCLLWYGYGRIEYPLALGIPLGISWYLLVAFSRIYLGVHSVMDVIGGSVLTALIAGVTHPFLGPDLEPIILSRGAWVALVTIPILLIILAPDGPSWSRTKSDTMCVLATVSGIFLGFWLQSNLFPIGVSPQDQPSCTWTVWVMIALLKFLVGMPILLLVKHLLRKPLIRVMLLMHSPSEVEPYRRMTVELPSVALTYGVLGVLTTYLIPGIFSLLNIA